MPRLRRSDCAAAGITRRGRGRGFEYLSVTGKRVRDAKTLARIAELAIPPAWRDVWICADALGHLQATGIDDAGRKQYLYHEAWRTRRDREKYDTMLAFGGVLPRLRRRVSRDLRGAASGELSRERALACAVRLLDIGLFRIGSDDYARDNESYGLTTLLREHVTVEGDEIVFDFPAKSGQRRVQSIADRDVRPVVVALKRRRSGDELLAYRDGRRWVDVNADDVNDYIKQASGADFSAKDFRTFNATVFAAVALARASGDGSRRRVVREAVAATAEQLGNTPAVCRRSYVDPRIIDRFESGETIDPTLSGRRQIESAVLELLA